jgi:hypothetical protein
MSNYPDEDLHERFRGLREQDLAAAPAFDGFVQRLTVRPPPHARTRRLWQGIAVGIVAGCLFLLIFPNHPPPVVAMPAWHSPTDFLLADAAGSLQRLSWAPLPATDFGQTSLNPDREKP